MQRELKIDKCMTETSPTQNPDATDTKPSAMVLSKQRKITAVSNFLIALSLVIFMDFGNRSHHFDSSKKYAGNVPTEVPTYQLEKLRLLTRCIGYVRANYVDPNRANAQKMLLASLDEVERSVPEFVSDPILDSKGHASGVRVQVGDTEKNFDLSDVKDLYRMNWRLLDIFRFVSPHLLDANDHREVEYAAVNGMLRTLDPHSVLLPPRVYKEMKMGTTGKFGGIGCVIGIRKNRLTVQSVMSDTPAARAGLKNGDQIIQIGAESTVNMSLRDAVKRLRGPPGTPVTIWVKQESFKETRKIRIIRSRIVLESVQSKLLEQGVAYSRIKHFQESTGKDLTQALLTLNKKARLNGTAIRGLILDLRDNPGGLLDQAIAVSNIFLDQGNIVTTVGAGSKIREERVATESNTWRELPVVVLVNSGSASASEIVAGAIRNNNRGVILGRQTFGKGSVQVLYDIDDSALKLTIAQYLTPGNQSIQGIGITPHVVLAPIVANKEHINLNVRTSGGESHLENSLSITQEKNTQKPAAHVAYVASKKDNQSNTDYAIRLASRVLAEAGHPTADEMLRRGQPILALANKEQTAKLVEALANLDVDWNDGQMNRKPRLKAEFVIDSKRPVEAGQSVNLKLKVTNVGKKTVHRVHARSKSTMNAFNGIDFVLGQIPPKETRSWSVEVNVPRATISQRVPVEALVYHASLDKAPLAAPKPTAYVEIQGLPRPRFAYSLQVLDPTGNGDGIANDNENVNLRLKIHNIGNGAAFKSVVSLRNQGGDEIFIQTGREVIDGLAPGQSRDISFALQIRKSVSVRGINLILSVTDTVLHQRMRHKINIPYAAKPGLQIEAKTQLWLTGKQDTKVYSGASKTTDVIGTLPPKTSFYSSAAIGQWIRANLKGTDHGWLNTAEINLAPADQAVPDRPQLVSKPQIYQPNIALSQNVPLETPLSSVNIDGDALFPSSTPQSRPDIYIFKDSSKVFFKRAKDSNNNKIPFSASISLDSGINNILIYARAGRNLLYKRKLVVLRRR